MNKQEIEQGIERVNNLIATLEPWLEEAVSIKAELQSQLEAEKPKLRHGDFGYAHEPCFPRIVLADNQLASASHVFKDHKNDRPTVILGNIFDLMKDWGEDLDEFEIKGAGKALLKVRIACDKKSFIFTLYDDSKFSPIVISIPAEEIWRQFGQMIMTLKRKQSKT